MNTYPDLTQEQIASEQASFISKVFGWMSLALVVTAITATQVAGSAAAIELIFSSRFVFLGLLLVEVLVVSYLSAAIGNMSATAATAVFLLYAILNGITFSVIFLIYTASSIAGTFFITAGTFAAMSAYGYFTKRDLTSWGNLLFMALIGLVIATVVNIFWNNSILYWITTYAGILIFVGLTAYDTQKIKELNIIGNEGTEDDRKEAIMGALTLYLDFINLFLLLLRLFGRKK
jgi:FtsH-binding integral membrane protein